MRMYVYVCLSRQGEDVDLWSCGGVQSTPGCECKHTHIGPGINLFTLGFIVYNPYSHTYNVHTALVCYCWFFFFRRQRIILIVMNIIIIIIMCECWACKSMLQKSLQLICQRTFAVCVLRFGERAIHTIQYCILHIIYMNVCVCMRATSFRTALEHMSCATKGDIFFYDANGIPAKVLLSASSACVWIIFGRAMACGRRSLLFGWHAFFRGRKIEYFHQSSLFSAILFRFFFFCSNFLFFDSAPRGATR